MTVETSPLLPMPVTSPTKQGVSTLSVLARLYHTVLTSKARARATHQQHQATTVTSTASQMEGVVAYTRTWSTEDRAPLSPTPQTPPTTRAPSCHTAHCNIWKILWNLALDAARNGAPRPGQPGCCSTQLVIGAELHPLTSPAEAVQHAHDDEEEDDYGAVCDCAEGGSWRMTNTEFSEFSEVSISIGRG